MQTQRSNSSCKLKVAALCVHSTCSAETEKQTREACLLAACMNFVRLHAIVYVPVEGGIHIIMPEMGNSRVPPETTS